MGERRSDGVVRVRGVGRVRRRGDRRHRRHARVRAKGKPVRELFQFGGICRWGGGRGGYLAIDGPRRTVRVQSAWVWGRWGRVRSVAARFAGEVSFGGERGRRAEQSLWVRAGDAGGRILQKRARSSGKVRARRVYTRS